MKKIEKKKLLMNCRSKEIRRWNRKKLNYNDEIKKANESKKIKNRLQKKNGNKEGRRKGKRRTGAFERKWPRGFSNDNPASV